MDLDLLQSSDDAAGISSGFNKNHYNVEQVPVVTHRLKRKV
jgi:hypothetical protein